MEAIKGARGWSFQEAARFYETVVPHLLGPELALLGANDRFFLLCTLLRRRDAAIEWVYYKCREVEAWPDGHLDLWARVHFKSTLITFAGTIQDIIDDPEVRICIFSFSNDAARAFVAQIKEELEVNDVLLKLYPDVFPQNAAERKAMRSWSVDGGLVVKRQGNPREATVEGHGLIEALPTGLHFPILVYDDVVTEREVSNPDMVK
jgi:hypothetical protein